jgi:glyoxylase-like metal-dependent hydrolase (beta-lactamase superfamily II)
LHLKTTQLTIGKPGMTTIHRIACPIPFPLKTVNCYYIADKRPTLIDTSVDTDASLAGLSDAIRQGGGNVAGLKRIVLTHAHTDHIGLAGRLARISGADVYLHRWDSPKIVVGDRRKTKQHLGRFSSFLEFAGLPMDIARGLTDGFARRLDALISPIDRLHLLSGGERFQFDDFQLRVVHTPGHSAGSICLLNEATRELFAGDTLLEKITPNPVAEISRPADIDPYRSIACYRRSLEKLAALKISRVMPGHGEVYTTAEQRIAVLERHFDYRRQLVLRKLQRGEGLTTLYGLTRSMFPSLKGMELFLGLSESFAYVQLLAEESRIESRETDKTYRFRLKQRE